MQHAVIQEQRTIIVCWVSNEKVSNSDITKQSYVCCHKVNLVLTSYTEVFLMEPNLHKGPNNFANTTFNQASCIKLHVLNLQPLFGVYVVLF